MSKIQLKTKTISKEAVTVSCLDIGETFTTTRGSVGDGTQRVFMKIYSDEEGETAVQLDTGHTWEDVDDWVCRRVNVVAEVTDHE